jgi:hypothetical protein
MNNEEIQDDIIITPDITLDSVKYWTIMDAWNQSLTVPSSFEPKPRNYLYASEVGGNMLEIYWRMIGLSPTNDKTDTSRRKMEAGNFYEALIVWVFKRCGLLKDTQTRVRLEAPGLLAVSGKLDLIAGCAGNWEQKLKEVEEYFDKLEVAGFDFPFFAQSKKLSLNTIKYLSEKYPQGFEDRIIEVKSINSMAFWAKNQPISEPYPHHVNQETFYLAYNDRGIRNGSILYVDRDTMSLSEIFILVREDVIAKQMKWIEEMTYYYNNKIEPPVPDLIVWNPSKKKYEYNWKIGWSEFKDKMLGTETEDSIRAKVKKMNAETKDASLLEHALKGEKLRGNANILRAIQMLNDGVLYDDIIKKTKISNKTLKELTNKLGLQLHLYEE